MAASDLGIGVAGGKLYAGFAEGAAFVVCLFDAERPELVCVVEADRLERVGRAEQVGDLPFGQVKRHAAEATSSG